LYNKQFSSMTGEPIAARSLRLTRSMECPARQPKSRGTSFKCQASVLRSDLITISLPSRSVQNNATNYEPTPASPVTVPMPGISNRSPFSHSSLIIDCVSVARRAWRKPQLASRACGYVCQRVRRSTPGNASMHCPPTHCVAPRRRCPTYRLQAPGCNYGHRPSEMPPTRGTQPAPAPPVQSRGRVHPQVALVSPMRRRRAEAPSRSVR
jgi:hypothetical protein